MGAGVDDLFVHTMAVNEGALRFYDQHGFAVVAEESANRAHYRRVPPPTLAHLAVQVLQPCKQRMRQFCGSGGGCAPCSVSNVVSLQSLCVVINVCYPYRRNA